MELTEHTGMNGGIKGVGEKLAGALDRGSDRLLSGAEALEDQALSTAMKLSDSAKFIRETTSRDVLQDCSALVSKYPLHALVAGTFAGLLLGRSIWRGRRG